MNNFIREVLFYNIQEEDQEDFNKFEDMILGKPKKKKGFTLIELVIVLAVLAIIALIAIPNFTKVRNNSLINSDIRSAEQIEKITLMAIADGDIQLTSSNQEFTVPGSAPGDLYSNVKIPQVPGQEAFKITVTENGEVGVKYSSVPEFGDAEEHLAGVEIE